MNDDNVHESKTHRGTGGAVSFAGVLAIPQSRALAIQHTTADGNPVHTLELQPFTGISDDPVIRRSHESAINGKGDSLVVTLATEGGTSEQEPPLRHVNRGRAGGSTSLGPCIEEGLG